MSERPATRVRTAILAAPWAMTPEMVQTLLSIADRDNLTPEALAAQLGRPLDNTRTVTQRDGVATIPVEGVIVRHADIFTEVSGGVSFDALATDLRAALDNPAIHGIVLMIDSPGGEANGCNEFAAMVRAANGIKPVVAYIGGLGGSAAYFVASAAGEIVVDAGALVGSIGTIMVVPDPQKRQSRSVEFVSSQSPHKRPDPHTEGGRSRLQAIVDDTADVFISAVSSYRGLAKEAIVAIGGDLLIGQKAVDAGLADRVGSYEGVVADLQQRAREPRRIGSGGHVAAQTTGGVMAEQNRPTEEQQAVGFMAHVRAFFTGEAVPQPGPPQGIVGTPARSDVLLPPSGTTASAESPELAAAMAEIARYQEAERTRATADLDQRATAFADGEITALRALPAERDALIAGYTDAANDDAAHPRAEGQPSRVARLAERHATRPAHGLTTEAVPVRVLDGGTLAILDTPQATRAEGADPAATPERYRDLLASNPATMRILAEHGIPATGALSAEHRALLTARMTAAGLVPAAR